MIWYPRANALLQNIYKPLSCLKAHLELLQGLPPRRLSSNTIILTATVIEKGLL
jgi:hypothetical protein